MSIQPAGFTWLQHQFKLSSHKLTHASYIGQNSSIELTSAGNIEQVFGPGYRPATNSIGDHLEFGLKYDHLNLDFLDAVFKQISPNEIEKFILKKPSGKYARKIGFLYEWITGQQLNLPESPNSNYSPLLEPGEYITGQAIRNRKWKIYDNLLGTKKFCPLVRKTRQLSELLQIDITGLLAQLKKQYPTELFTRAIRYLYSKETKSSFEIEREQPSYDRLDRFISLLANAGKVQDELMLNKKRLIELQNAIVDPRFAVTDIRNFQNFVGESLPNGHDLVHYICPPPEDVNSLMEGLGDLVLKTAEETRPEIRAAIISFGFVFIHPFEDGNGRLHRFLIHDILVHDNVVPAGMIIPVSAHMLNHIGRYDAILEAYSKPLLQRIKYVKNDQGEISITNRQEVEGYFKYPDLTDQCIYLLETLHATLRQDMPDEFIFLQRYDQAKAAFQSIVDMPDRDINLMLIYFHQNKGIFPKRRRDRFLKLSDEEIIEMQAVYQKIYEIHSS